jgi:hypothetical protein
MLMCLPKSICDRNYRVTGLPDGVAEVDFDTFSEQGTITIDGEPLRVRKHGAMSGRWTLERDGEVLAEAVKTSAMTRSVEIRTLGVTLNLDAKSAISYEFILSHDGNRCGSIRPMHSLTRRAYVDCDPSIDSITQLFAFWMVALMWRRAEAAAAS